MLNFFSLLVIDNLNLVLHACEYLYSDLHKSLTNRSFILRAVLIGPWGEGFPNRNFFSSIDLMGGKGGPRGFFIFFIIFQFCSFYWIIGWLLSCDET